MDYKEFKKDFLLNLKKIKVNKHENLFVTSNLKKISHIRIKKKDKLDAILNSLIQSAGKNYSIYVPTATLNLCNTNNIFDIQKTPSKDMGPLAEYVRNSKGSVRSFHPYWSVSGIGKNSNLLKKVSKHAYGFGSPWSIMLDLDFLQVNIGIHPSKAVTLVHHLETVIGVPYRFNKLFSHPIKNKNKIYIDNFYMSVFFKKLNVQKKKKLNEHFFNLMKKKNKLNYTKNKYGLEMWSFKMRDFFEISSKFFLKNIFTYLESVPNFEKIKDN